MARHYNSFDFVGELSLPKDKVKQYVVDKFESGWERHKLALSVRESKANSVYLETATMYNPSETHTVYSMSKDGGKLELAFKDRFTALPMVADFRKLVFDMETDQELKSEALSLSYRIRELEKKEQLTDDESEKLENYIKEYNNKTNKRNEFITEYDLINFIKDNYEEISKHKVRVRGNIEMSEWKGKYYVKYIPTTFELVPAEYDNKLSIKVDVFFKKGALDDSDLKEGKKIFIDGYLMNNDRTAKGDRYFPKTFVINATNVNFEDARQMAILGFTKDLFNIKGKEYHHLIWEGRIYRGAEIKEFTEEELTPMQKTQIALGLATLEDFKPRGQIFGASIEEMRLTNPQLKGVFADGAVEAEQSVDEFEELIITSTADVKYDDVKKSNNDVKTNFENDMNSLFN